jgi:hypothetical protein
VRRKEKEMKKQKKDGSHKIKRQTVQKLVQKKGEI